MDAAGVPTAGWVATSSRDEALAALDRFGRPAPWVVKADGLAAGKGVVVTSDRAEAEAAVDAALVARRFGDAGATLVIEEFLAGPERSLFAVCDGEDAVLLAPAQDHKRALDGDEGPNTGGMGAFCPVEGFALGGAARRCAARESSSCRCCASWRARHPVPRAALRRPRRHGRRTEGAGVQRALR
jgi:phosphoribosylamine---glycine ligase